MYVSKLSLLNFKNYAEAQFEFCEGINCFTGDNGEGKTNLLDAIHYLSFCKSYFNAIDSQNISFEAPFFVIQAQVTHASNDLTEEIYCGQKRNQKKYSSATRSSTSVWPITSGSIHWSWYHLPMLT